MIDLNKLIQTIKRHPDYSKMGMIASHLGIVRGNSLDGRQISSLDISFNKNIIDNIVANIKGLPGIYEVLIEASQGNLKVGEDIMAIVIGGDTRSHVFPALIELVNQVKDKGAKKKEYF